MAGELATSDSGYTNRPAMRKQARRLRIENHSGRHATGRAVERIRLALCAYEQREERRAALYSWLAARGALNNRP